MFHQINLQNEKGSEMGVLLGQLEEEPEIGFVDPEMITVDLEMFAVSCGKLNEKEGCSLIHTEGWGWITGKQRGWHLSFIYERTKSDSSSNTPDDGRSHAPKQDHEI